jgi:hypothetical protein
LPEAPANNRRRYPVIQFEEKRTADAFSAREIEALLECFPRAFEEPPS